MFVLPLFQLGVPLFSFQYRVQDVMFMISVTLCGGVVFLLFAVFAVLMGAD